MQDHPAWRSEPIWILAGLLLIPAVIERNLPGLSTGRFLLLLAIGFLAHSLVRDLVILWKLRRGAGGDASPRRIRCFCLETPVGMLFLLVALGSYWSWPAGPLPGGWLVVAVGTGATLLGNYLMRDLVIRWNPLSIARDPGHYSIIPRP